MGSIIVGLGICFLIFCCIRNSMIKKEVKRKNEDELLINTLHEMYDACVNLSEVIEDTQYILRSKPISMYTMDEKALVEGTPIAGFENIMQIRKENLINIAQIYGKYKEVNSVRQIPGPEKLKRYLKDNGDWTNCTFRPGLITTVKYYNELTSKCKYIIESNKENSNKEKYHYIECRYCGGSYSDYFDKCPHCGAPKGER